ncbi:hypothetical protein [Roseomonas indoligenes]|uniref:Uncharacterized protein n=1 Tax=Roseomonas indoligenes TaxID=2820811 RepID=A0A940N312_9PROT|nr:hypothetical protein [Pararoseomonas indoligenes]MBP0493282.1 hypothetical protein [Pararoseomonas indoligenes]
MPTRPAKSTGRSESADPFDLWLRRSLHENWDAALNERVPDDLLRLFSDDRVEWESMKARWLAADPRRDP